MPRTPLALLSVVVLSGCSSSADPGSTPRPTCTVNCPTGTYCDGDRCLPICAPPCGPSEHCGTDNVCHAGPAPDGNVVPHLDGGPPNKDGPTTATDTGPKPDTLDPNKQLCDCVAKQPKAAYCQKQAVTCQVAADCCTQSTIPCGTYGNKYTCSAGKCVRAGCGSKSECVSYAQILQQADAAGWDCHTAVCPGIPDYCSLIKPGCTTASDCCTGGNVPCGLYSNHWTCDSGACTFLGCVSDPECVSYAQAIGVSDPSTYVCRKSTCGNTGYCMPKPKPCSTPADCCNPSSTVPCGVYTNRYRCENGGCVMDYCTSYQDCQSYAGALKLPDASQYNCVVY